MCTHHLEGIDLCLISNDAIVTSHKNDELNIIDISFAFVWIIFLSCDVCMTITGGAHNLPVYMQSE